MKFTSIPVVDFGNLQAAPDRFFADLQHALCDVGFMVAVNVPGFDVAFQQRVFAEAHAFFDRPQDEKDKSDVTHSPHFRGYSRGDYAELPVESRSHVEGTALPSGHAANFSPSYSV